ncbi:MAG TPA: YqjD family protein [Burkholderiales bacterium]|nr:YqjD family protein [Burkholderiales bacterium]
MTTDTHFTDAQISKDKIKSDLKTVFSDMDEYLRATASQTGEKIGIIRERLQEHMHKAKDRLADTKEIVVDKTKEAAKATDEYVHDNPWHAVGIAAGVGLIVGMLIGRR